MCVFNLYLKKTNYWNKLKTGHAPKKTDILYGSIIINHRQIREKYCFMKTKFLSKKKNIT